ncbi:hypothetical protein [Streptacidiphilus fuscans]|uniref:Uncharacterized protein n=1 Tax=Streptacidiphilus fuscans TaxID=2789292 RepID=A0A931BGR6_9ACTN|nr:hypothetical protein [Streptacidiphilus fuscans]MBF9067785.1 hypothetical protein [Streptacidiphilus fuscans]MBF9073868.1 hypothetical protein [Streptacidiphilus fuscans]
MNGTQSDDFERDQAGQTSQPSQTVPGQAQPGWGVPPQGAYPPPPPPPAWPGAPLPRPPHRDLSQRSATLAVLLAVLATAITAFYLVTGAGTYFAYDAGLAGTPGTYTATSCQKSGSTKDPNIDCQGTFTPSDGSAVVRDVAVHNTKAAVGHPIALRREGDGTSYAQSGFANATIDLAMGLAGLTVLGFVLFRIGVGRTYANAGERRRHQQLRRQQRLERGQQPVDREAVSKVLLGKDHAPGEGPRKRSRTSTLRTPWRQISGTGLWLIALSLPFALLIGAVGVIAEVVNGN